MLQGVWHRVSGQLCLLYVKGTSVGLWLVKGDLLVICVLSLVFSPQSPDGVPPA